MGKISFLCAFSCGVRFDAAAVGAPEMQAKRKEWKINFPGTTFEAAPECGLDGRENFFGARGGNCQKSAVYGGNRCEKVEKIEKS